MKNILFTIQNGFSSRYIVRSGFIKLCSEKIDSTVYVSVPDKIDFINSMNNNDKQVVKIIQQPRLLPQSFFKKNILSIINQIQVFGMPRDPKFSALWVKKLLFKKNVHISYALRIFILLMSHIHSKLFIIRKIFRIIVSNYQTDENFKKLLIELDINEIVLDGISSTIPDNTYWISAAKQLGIKTTIIITNWDHPTTRGYQTIESDEYIVWGPSMKHEMTFYQDSPEKNIREMGSIIFDYYHNNSFHKNINHTLFPKGRSKSSYMLFITNSPYYPHNFSIMRFINNILPEDIKLYVRLHPLYLTCGFEAECAKFKDFDNKNDKVIIIYPKSQCRSLPGDMSYDEIQLSSVLLANSHLIISTMSTMVLDAIILNKKVVNISFDWVKKELIPLKMSLLQNRIHVKRAAVAKNILHARSKSELKHMILNNLESKDYNYDHKARLKFPLVIQECGKIDGLVSKRITKHLVT